jgi:hypothetical protein
MKITQILIGILATSFQMINGQQCKAVSAVPRIMPQSSCVSFQVASGTGCAWMCDYCANQLGTNNYYFTDGVCTYESSGCQGYPLAGKTYTCCSS